jgi:hypothetical protein
MLENPTLVKWLIDPAERAGKTFVQQFTVVLMAASTAGIMIQQNWLKAADSALFAAAISLLSTYILILAGLGMLSPYLDLIVRCAKTFLASFVGALTASDLTSAVQTDWKGALAVAVPVTVLALIMGIAALANPATIGAGLVPDYAARHEARVT